MLFTGLSRGMSDDLQRRSSNVRAEIIFTRPGSFQATSSPANLSTKYVDMLNKLEGVEAAVPVIRYVYPSGTWGVDQVEGVDWDSFAQMSNVRLVQGRGPKANDENVIDETKASRNHPVGSGLKIFGEKEFKVVGIFAPESGARAKLTLEAMQSLLEVPGKCSYILVKCRNQAEQIAVAKRINEQLPGNKVQLTGDFFPSIESSVPGLAVFMRVLVALASVVSALVVMLAMYTTITERTREIGILKALGASRGYIVGIIEKEAIIISLIGLAVGFVLSFIAGFVIHRL